MSRKTVASAGLALIVAPLVALAVKFMVYPGWMVVIIIVMLGVPLLIGYILQVLIASLSMLRTRGSFNRMPGARRGITAAWLTSVAVILSSFFLVDGGDDGTYGSAFTLILGSSSTAAGEQFSMLFFSLFALIWLAGWIWLMVEWILLSARAKRETSLLTTPQPPRE